MTHSVLRRRARRSALIGLVAGVVFVAFGPGVRTAPSADVAAMVPEVRPLERSPERPVAVDAAPTLVATVPGATTAPAAAPAAPAEPAPEPAYTLPASAIDPAQASPEGDTLVQTLEGGERVVFTLDPMLQRAALRSLEKYKTEYGILVAIRPQTGEILALAEHAELRPELRNLALQAEGPAASIFKLVTAAALLEFSTLQPSDTICTHGGLKGISLEHLRPNAKLDKKCESFAEALGASNNAAFGRWADQLLRPAQLQAMADRFLFNRRLPFLWGVATSRAAIPTGSRLGFARSAAGFEGSQMSPLHAALIASAIANDGEMMAPRLVARVDRGEETLYSAEPAVLAQVLTPDIAQRLRAMMVATTTTGTGKKFFERKGKPRLPVAVAGKTGSLSAQDTGVSRHYSWFVAAAPAEHPEIVIASLVVNGESWTVKGVVPAREVLEQWFMRKDTGHAAAH